MDNLLNRKNGIYLVIDPSESLGQLVAKLKSALNVEDAVVAVQIWDHFPETIDPEIIIEQIKKICVEKNVPVLVNNHWEWVKKYNLSGVHFDEMIADLDKVREHLGPNSILGITVNNDLELIKWARDKQLNYISFCSVFPSKTSNSCDLVQFKTIKEARSITNMPIYLAGGINTENIQQLKDLNFEGIAVISGIMNATDPGIAVKQYLDKLKSSNEN